MDKKTQRIIEKCHRLMERGYGLEYCLKIFNSSKKEILDYFSIAEDIGRLKKVNPSDDFRKNSLDSIISRADVLEAQNSVPAVPRVAPGRLIMRPAIIFIAFIVISVFSFAGTLFASQDSIPGETLYPLKRSFEEFQLNIYPEGMKGGLHLRFLNKRIEEAEILLDVENDIDPSLIQELISEVDRQYQACNLYDCIEPGNEDTILDSINSLKNRYRNRFGDNPGKKDADDGMDQNEKYNNTMDSNGINKGQKNSQGNGKGKNN